MNWQEIPESHLASWNRRLLLTDASFVQFPYWNEAYRVLRCRSVYLAYGDLQSPLAYVCIVTIRAGLRIGVVQRGPVELVRGAPTDELVRSLCDWARAHGYAFLRFSHTDGGWLARIADLQSAHRFDSFPLYPGYASAPFELVVDNKGGERATLNGFHREARRQVRRALEAGYVVRSSDDPDQVTEAWPIFAGCSRRKGFPMHWPMESYLEMTRLARRHACVRIYTVYSGERAIAAALVVRDKNTAVALRAASELTKPSCSALLHWTAMQDVFRAGVRSYSFGSASPPVSRFKDRFHPRRVLCPPPVTVEMNPSFCRIWHAVLPGLVAVAPALRWLARAIAVSRPARAGETARTTDLREPALGPNRRRP